MDKDISIFGQFWSTKIWSTKILVLKVLRVKFFLKVWQTLAIKRFESQLPQIKFSDSSESGGKDSEENEDNTNSAEIQELPTKKDNEKPTSSTLIDPNYTETLNNLTYFNEDIVCPHGNLSPTPNKKLISAQIWHQYFEDYFYKKSGEAETKQAPIFTSEVQPCKTCLVTLIYKNDLLLVLIILLKSKTFSNFQIRQIKIIY